VSVANGMFGRDEKKYIQGFAGEICRKESTRTTFS